ncbi:hypothetical protein [Parenemella sanctibonifatiensis]|uniref:Yip1 domain-containing protein n=1 Tax=Parenemella sanctibonifatiensis TaxID=2016505 RepID=A0A255E164_9ACTN|nr:hypothetical protein [Parenemella sanctibonifatiensis]OYN85307.1 hypothetical protein CGZ92_10925 [Parenemella sanctibonifatiensis]
MEPLLQWLAAVFSVLAEALSFDETLAQGWPQAPPTTAAIGIAVLVTLSMAAGQCGILFLNQVPAGRLWSAVGVGFAVIIALRAVSALVVWGFATLATGTIVRPSVILVTMVVALAPQVFAVITMTPYLGLLFGRILEGWEFVVTFALITALYAMPGWQGFLVVGAAWLVLQLGSRLLAEPSRAIGTRLWTLATGQPTLITAADLLAGTPLVPINQPTAGRSALDGHGNRS